MVQTSNPTKIYILLVALAILIAGGLYIYFNPSDSKEKPNSVESIESKKDSFAGTLKMAQRLKTLAEDSNPEENPFLNSKRAQLYKDSLRGNLSSQERFDLNIHAGLEFLRAGQTEESIPYLKEAQSLAFQFKADEKGAQRWMATQFLGLAYLRLGEQQNCIALHTSHSCLFPISEKGQHKVPLGSKKAIEFFTSALEIHQRDLTSIWLMNIAHMTLGQYPQGVNPHYLLPAGIFKSKVSFPRFIDQATEAGVAIEGLSGGVIVEDLDGDSDLDILCSSWGMEDPLQLLLQTEGGKFENASNQPGLQGITGGLNLVHADPDNDGDFDILVLRGAWMNQEGRIPNSYLKNLGGGKFVDATEETGLLTSLPTQTAAWADFDGDGWLDLFIGNESDPTNRNPCQLFWNQRDGTFVECAKAIGLDFVGFVKGVAWGDIDNDGRPDLYLSCLGEKNRLFKNNGPQGSSSTSSTFDGKNWSFSEITDQAGVSKPLNSFPVWFWDYNNDGHLDLLVLSYGWDRTTEKVAADYLSIANDGERPVLYKNLGKGKFEDVTAKVGLDKVLIAMGANYGDLNNDGWLDFYVGTGEPNLASLMPNRMFLNDRGKRFIDVTTSGGFGHLQKGHGIAFADFDRDGDQDIYAVMGGAYEGDRFQNALFMNPVEGAAEAWIKLKLVGIQANRSAQGARIKITCFQGERQGQVLYRYLNFGGSFGSSPSLCEVGLGPQVTHVAVSIKWPGSGKVSNYGKLTVRKLHELTESNK